MISTKERDWLSQLAERYARIAELPVMKERERLWYGHNALRGERPPVVVEMLTFEDEMLPPLQCESEMGKRVEKELLRGIVGHEMIDDDKVVPPCFQLPLDIHIRKFDLDEKREYATDGAGHRLGYRQEHFILDIEEDLPKLSHSVFSYDAEATEAYRRFVQNAIGHVLPIEEVNKSLEWHFGISQRVIELMGMEALMYALVDSPDAVSALYEFVTNDMLALLDWEEAQGLLRANNGCHYTGAGSYGFTHRLNPVPPVRRTMLWGNMNSQETASISPQMYHDYIFPFYRRLAENFGLVYYGCCEPVHDIWQDLGTLPGLAKVSISPWCDEEKMGVALRGGSVIYSRKPSPNYLGVGAELDEEAYAQHIRRTLTCARGCEVEFIHRDVYTLNGNAGKIKRAVEIARREIDRTWK